MPLVVGMDTVFQKLCVVGFYPKAVDVDKRNIVLYADGSGYAVVLLDVLILIGFLWIPWYRIDFGLVHRK